MAAILVQAVGAERDNSDACVVCMGTWNWNRCAAQDDEVEEKRPFERCVSLSSTAGGKMIKGCGNCIWLGCEHDCS